MASAGWFAILLGMFALVDTGTCRAQVTPSKHSSDALANNNTHENVATAAASAPVVADQAIASDAEANAAPQVGLPRDDSGWHVVVAPYLWLPGVYGTVGARDRDVNVDATPGDLLSNFRFGLMGLVDLRYKRIVIPLDMVWVRLEDD